MVDIGNLTAHIGLDTSDLDEAAKKAGQTIDHLSDNLAHVSDKSTEPLKKAADGADKMGKSLSNATARAAGLLAKTAGMPPVFTRMIAVFATSTIGIGALTAGVALLVTQLADSNSTLRRWIAGHEGAVRAISEHRDALDRLAASGLEYDHIAQGLLGLANAQAQADRKRAGAALELALAGKVQIGVWQRLNSLISGDPLTALRGYINVSGAEQLRLVTDLSAAISDLNKELNLYEDRVRIGASFQREVEGLMAKAEEAARERTRLLKEQAAVLDAFQARWDRIIRDRDMQLEDAFAKRLKAQQEQISWQRSLANGMSPLEGVPEGQMSMISDQILAERQALEGLMRQDNLTRTEMINSAERYKAVMQEVIALDAEHMRELGVSSETISMIVESRTAEVADRTDAMLRKSLGGLRGWIYNLSQDLNAAFEDSFFRALKGQFDSFYSYIEAITDVFLRRIAQQMADKIFTASGTGGWLADLLGKGGGHVAGTQIGEATATSPATFATGGLVMRPTFAMVGESGPEAVVPLGKMNDPNFWNSLGVGSHPEASKGGDTYVTMHITTPDVQSFKASESQIMARMASRFARSGRRNL